MHSLKIKVRIFYFPDLHIRKLNKFLARIEKFIARRKLKLRKH